MANRPKENRAEQDDAPNFKMIKPPDAGIHATVGHGLTKEGSSAQNQSQGQQGQD